MRKHVLLVVSCLLLCATAKLHSQFMPIYDVRTTGFPRVEIDFQVVDSNRNIVSTLTRTDIALRENGQNIPVSSLQYIPSIPGSGTPLSVVFTLDISGSMRAGRMDIARNAAIAATSIMSFAPGQAAVTSFDDRAYLNQDLTTDRARINSALASLQPQRGTNYNAAFLDSFAGALPIIARGTNRRVVIFLTDGLSEQPTRVSEIVNFARANNITIHCVVLGLPASDELRQIAQQTGGQLFENVNDQGAAESAFSRIVVAGQGSGGLYRLAYDSQISCDTNRRADITIPTVNNAVRTLSFSAPRTSIPQLQANTTGVSFVNAPIGATQQTVILTAPNRAVQITGIAQSGNNRFTLSGLTFPRTINAGESIPLTIRFAGTIDSSSVFAQFVFQGENCPFTISASANYTAALQPNAIGIVTPNGGERLVIGRDSAITWSGLRSTDTTEIAYSINNGRTWTTLATNATGSTSFAWRNIPAPATDSALARVRQITSLVAPPQVVRRMTAPGGVALTVLESSPDGSVVVGRTENVEDLRCWVLDPATGQTLRTFLPAIDGGIYAHKLLNNTTMLIWNGGIWSLVDIATGNILRTLRFPSLPNAGIFGYSPLQFRTIEVSPDRQFLFQSIFVSTQQTGSCAVYDIRNLLNGGSPQLVSVLGTPDEQHVGAPQIISVTPTRLSTFSYSSNRTEIKVWDYTQNRLLKTQTFINNTPTGFPINGSGCLSSDGSEMLIVRFDGNNLFAEVHPAVGDNTQPTARPYTQQGYLNLQPIGFFSNNTQVIFSRLGQGISADTLSFLTMQKSGSNIVVQRSTSQVLPSSYFGRSIYTLPLLSNATPTLLGISPYDGFLWQWNPNGSTVQTLQPNQRGRFQALALHPRGTQVAVMNANGNSPRADSLFAYNPITNQILWSKPNIDNSFSSLLVYAPDGATLYALLQVSNATTNTVTILALNATDGRELRRFTISSNINVGSARGYMLNNSLLVLVDQNNKQVVGVNVQTQQVLYTLTLSLATNDYLYPFLALPTGTSTDIIAVSVLGQLIQINPQTGTIVNTRATGQLYNIRAISNNGQFIAVGNTSPGTQRILDVISNAVVATVPGNNSGYFASQDGIFSTDGSKYASVRTDTLIVSGTIATLRVRNIVHTYDLRRQVLLGRTVLDTFAVTNRQVLELSNDGTYLLTYSPNSSSADVIRLNLFSQPEAISANVWSIIVPQVTAQDIDMGALRVGNRKDSLITVFVRNPNSFTLPIDSLRLSGANASEFGIVSGIPPYTLNPGETRGIELRFAPTAAGVRTAQVQIFARGATTTATIRGAGVVPNLFPQVRDVDMGDVVVGTQAQTSATLFLSLTSSTINIRILRMTVLGQTDQFTISTGSSITVAPGRNVVFDIQFAPIRTGRSSVIVRFETDDPDNPILDARITGNGTRTLQLATLNYDFGNVVVGRTVPTTATLFVSQTSSTVPVTIRRMTVLGATDQFTVQNTGSSIIVQPRASVTFPIQFTPTRLGLSSVTLRFETDDPDNPILDARITGTGIRTIGVQTTNFDFGGVLVNSTTTATANLFVSLPISTIGLTVSAVLDGGNPLPFAILSPTRATVVGIGQSLPVQLRFTPNQRTSFATSVLFTVQEDGSQYRAQITGSGVLPSATLQADTLTATPGQEITVPIRLGATSFFNQVTENIISVQVRFNASVLQPIGNTPQGRIVNNTTTNLPERVITLDIPRSGAQNILQTLQFKAALGNTTATAFILENARVASGNADIQTANGLIRFTGLNQAGGTRLYWTEQGRIRIQSVSPNPIADHITLRVTAEESEQVSLRLVNMLGTTEQILWQGTLQAGENTLALAGAKLPQGMYSLILTAQNGYRTTVPVMIVR